MTPSFCGKVLNSYSVFSNPWPVVGLELDVKNKKVFANLKLLESKPRLPIRVDVADCTVIPTVVYPGHHYNG